MEVTGGLRPRRRWLVTHVLLLPELAPLADHVAAPLELAVAFLAAVADPRLVPPPAAEQPAAVHPRAGLVAHAALGAEDVVPENEKAVTHFTETST